ncbi:MAG: tyrosine--tRNA ligase [Thermoleophilaceae bacterium]|nr:tyrosine--tRNA ligase [Thermoleophilaceae bacterium]
MTSPACGSAKDTVARLTRNAVDTLPEGALRRQLGEGRPLRVKLGIDPTAPDIHLGHTVILRKLREFQELGHTVVLIVGDYTARVGDPSGRSSTRPMLSGEEIDANAETFRRQASTVLDPDLTEVRHNGEWLDMSMEALFRLARTPTVAQLLERDDFARRYSAREPISILELLYPLLQGYDSVAVRADVELGGTDQKFNLLLGRGIQQAYGLEPQSILTMPILPGIDGVQRMSKSLGNYVGVSEAPDEVFGKLMRVPDTAMGTYHDLLLDSPLDKSRPPVESKRGMARALTARLHGEEAATIAEGHFDRLHVQRAAPDEIEELVIAPPDGAVHLPALLREAFGISASEGRRLLAAGGVRLDGEPLSADALDLEGDVLDGSVLQVGRRRFRRVRIAGGGTAL